MEQLSIFDFLEPKPHPKVKPYSHEKMVEILKQKAIDNNMLDVFKTNIAIYFATPSSSLDRRFDDEDIKKYFKTFTKTFNSFCYHIYTDDLIVELPPITTLKEELCAPACAIDWYYKDGTRADMQDYLIKKENEILTEEIRQPADSDKMSFSEYRKDRREYYFFNIIKLHKFGKSGRVSKDFKYDTFTNYTWTLWDIASYYGEAKA